MSTSTAIDPLQREKLLNEWADRLYPLSTRAGERLAGAGDSLKRHQVEGLEAIANSTPRLTDVFDYLKRQTGKAKDGEGWRWRGTGIDKDGEKVLGPMMLELVTKRLAKALKDIFEDLNLSDVANELDNYTADHAALHLDLVRQVIRQVVVSYRYETRDRQDDRS